MRTFKTGATRDDDFGKLEYSNYIHPLCDFSYARYMKTKQIIDGEYREWDNRQKGIPKDSLLASLVRHTEILKLLYKWYEVYELENGEIVVNPENIQEWSNRKTIENELNAIRFNGEALKLYYIQ